MSKIYKIYKDYWIFRIQTTLKIHYTKLIKTLKDKDYQVLVERRLLCHRILKYQTILWIIIYNNRFNQINNLVKLYKLRAFNSRLKIFNSNSLIKFSIIWILIRCYLLPVWDRILHILTFKLRWWWILMLAS